MWGKKKQSKDQNTTTIKQTTKIKEKYTIPTSNLNPQLTLPTGNHQPNYQTSNLPLQISNQETFPAEKSVDKRNKSRSSSSSSEKNKRKNMESSLGNSKKLGVIQDAPLVQSNVFPTSNDIRYNTSDFYSDGTGNVHLGKNLYGETGYASPYYLLQQPFPGQTVYVENWKQNIPERTRSKFLRSSYPQQNLNLIDSQKVNLQTSVPPVSQNYEALINRDTNLYSDTNRIAFEQKLQSPTKQTITNPVTISFKEGANTIDNALTTNVKQVESTLGSKNQTVIKEKTKIKQKYTVPAQEINKIVNVPTRDSDFQYTIKNQGQTTNLQYTQPPAASSSLKYTEPQIQTSNLQSGPRYGLIQSEVPVTNLSQYNAANVDLKRGSKDETVIKQKTKIKENYTIPAQNINVVNQPTAVTKQASDQRYTSQYNQNSYRQEMSMPAKTSMFSGKTSNVPLQTSNIQTQNASYPVQTSNYGTSGDTKNLQYLQNKYGQNEFSMKAGQASTLQNINTESKMRRKRDSSSSSSSSKEKSRKMNLDTGLGSKSGIKIETINQPVLSQQNYVPTRNIQTGYGPMGGQINMNENKMVANSSYGNTVYSGAPLGKNLYGQTGFASLQYSIQQPFPGQTVYVPESPSKILNRTKARFSETAF